jgi:Zn-dependent M32 family carboxypeptidase
MQTESNDTQVIKPVTIDPNDPTNDLSSEPDELTEETRALVNAVRTRAQVDAKSAGDFTRETYLNTVRQLREAVEANKLFDPEQIEQSFNIVQQEAEKNWNAIVKEVNDFGDRLSQASKAAWEIMTKSNDEPKQ